MRTRDSVIEIHSLVIFFGRRLNIESSKKGARCSAQQRPRGYRFFFELIVGPAASTAAATETHIKIMRAPAPPFRTRVAPIIAIIVTHAMTAAPIVRMVLAELAAPIHLLQQAAVSRSGRRDHGERRHLYRCGLSRRLSRGQRRKADGGGGKSHFHFQH
ncbi:MAG: hypothetical protein WBP94_07805 [Rhodomicrobiaceae bacterium]